MILLFRFGINEKCSWAEFLFIFEIYFVFICFYTAIKEALKNIAILCIFVKNAMPFE